VTDTRQIVHIEWGASEDWAVWSVGEGRTHAAEIAAKRVRDANALTAATAGIRALDEYATQQPGTWSLGVWLPDTGTGRAAATVLVRTIQPDGPHRMTQDELLAWACMPPRTRGVKVLTVEAAAGEVAAGPVVLQVVETVPRFSRRITAAMNWYILPPGTDEIVLCQFETEQMDLFEAMSQETNTVTDSVVVHLNTPDRA